MGLHIGSIYAGLVAVADDLLYLADNEKDMQCKVNVQGDYAGDERYTVRDTKTKTMTHNQYTKFEPIISMNGKVIENEDSYKHLGLIRYSKLNDYAELITERIQFARNTANSLMGAGLHGLNGVNREVSVTLWNLYIKPTLLYGLESIQLSRTDKSKLEKYQRDFLRQIQHLPESIASYSVYILTGLLPIEAEIHSLSLHYLVILFARIVWREI